eukprot:COSAG05_NODE_6660_length_924_cov_81.672727_1_plen_251_part_00
MVSTTARPLLALLMLASAAAAAVAGPPSTCQAGLVQWCGAFKGDVFNCTSCSGVHWNRLQALGCDATTIALWCSSVSPGPMDDTVLTQDFCSKFYAGALNLSTCERTLAPTVRANHSRMLPTLELGDPSKPPLVFFHGWPDNAALWANQFEHFCAPPSGQYHCIAPTFFNYHPDLPLKPDSELRQDLLVDAFYSTAMEAVADKQKTNLTIVIFDWGAIIGAQLCACACVRSLICIAMLMQVTSLRTGTRT